MTGRPGMKRTPRPAKPDRSKGQARPAAWPPESHTGEGAASALENLQNQQRRRNLQAPAFEVGRKPTPDKD